jgi:hypothetical protein
MTDTARGQADHRAAFDFETAMKWLRARHEARSPGKPFSETAALAWATAVTMQLATGEMPVKEVTSADQTS